MTCSQCGAPQQVDDRKCSYCGVGFKSASEPLLGMNHNRLNREIYGEGGFPIAICDPTIEEFRHYYEAEIAGARSLTRPTPEGMGDRFRQ